jgi:hypothetical protein
MGMKLFINFANVSNNPAMSAILKGSPHGLQINSPYVRSSFFS